MILYQKIDGSDVNKETLWMLLNNWAFNCKRNEVSSETSMGQCTCVIANSIKPHGLAYYARRQSERHIGAKSFVKPLMNFCISTHF